MTRFSNLARLLLRGKQSFAKEFTRMSAQENNVPLPLRSHTILGVCEAIGEDFGFNPTFLRVILAAMVLYSPTIAIGAYFALGAVVLASRLLFPNAERPLPAQSDTRTTSEDLRLAA
jgi:phage shock protein PspC (stress-responsive transcriptional regulator)